MNPKLHFIAGLCFGMAITSGLYMLWFHSLAAAAFFAGTVVFFFAVISEEPW